MIVTSPNAAANFRTPRAQIIYLDLLESEYRLLLELRELVKKAEGAVALRTRRSSRRVRRSHNARVRM